MNNKALAFAEALIKAKLILEETVRSNMAGFPIETQAAIITENYRAFGNLVETAKDVLHEEKFLAWKERFEK